MSDSADRFFFDSVTQLLRCFRTIHLDGCPVLPRGAGSWVFFWSELFASAATSLIPSRTVIRPNTTLRPRAPRRALFSGAPSRHPFPTPGERATLSRVPSFCVDLGEVSEIRWTFFPLPISLLNFEPRAFSSSELNPSLLEFAIASFLWS